MLRVPIGGRELDKGLDCFKLWLYASDNVFDIANAKLIVKLSSCNNLILGVEGMGL